MPEQYEDVRLDFLKLRRKVAQLLPPNSEGRRLLLKSTKMTELARLQLSMQQIPKETLEYIASSSWKSIISDVMKSMTYLLIVAGLSYLLHLGHGYAKLILGLLMVGFTAGAVWIALGAAKTLFSLRTIRKYYDSLQERSESLLDELQRLGKKNK